MKRFLLAFFVSWSTLYGITLDKIIENALHESPSLESINHRIAASRADINIAGQFANPEILYTQNGLDDKQAMSQKTFTFKQKLPYFGKRESLQRVAVAQQEILLKNRDKAESALVFAIKNQAYMIWELQSLRQIISNYEILTKQNIDLFSLYSATSNNQHIGIISAGLTLLDLRIQKNRLDAKISGAYARLSSLASSKIEALQINLAISDMPDIETLYKGVVNNHDIALREKELLKERANMQSAQMNHYPDIAIVGGYAYRENFDNYWSFGVGMTLPIYGTEDYKVEEARSLEMMTQSLKEETKLAVNAQFEAQYANMKSAYETYFIVHDEALPQVEHMLELTNASIAVGGDFFKYIDILIQKLKLEQKSIHAVAEYNRAYAKISQLSGEIQ